MGPATQIMPQCAASVHSLWDLCCPVQDPRIPTAPRVSTGYQRVRQSFAMIFGSFLKPPFVTGCFPRDHVQSDSKAMRFRRQPPTEALWSMDPWMRRSLCQLGLEQLVSLNKSWIVNVYNIHLGQQKHVAMDSCCTNGTILRAAKTLGPNH